MQSILKVEEAVQGYLAITVSGHSGNKKYTVRTNVYMDIGSPCRGDVLSDDSLEMLMRADEYYRAKRAALSILSYGDNNERTLKTKLRTRSISDEIAAEVVTEMVSLGYIDEQRQLSRLISEEANRKLIGPRKIIPKLLSKGYSMKDVRQVIDELTSSGEVDFGENRERLLERQGYLADDDEQIKKLLYKYGYDF